MKKSDRIFNIRFVQLVELYPQIYNYKLPSYNKTSETDKAWIEISKALNGSLSITACMEKWQILRSGYNRFLRVNEAKHTLTKSYYLANYMKFVVPYLKSRKVSKFPENVDTYSNKIDLEDDYTCLIDENKSESIKEEHNSSNSSREEELNLPHPNRDEEQNPFSESNFNFDNTTAYSLHSQDVEQSKSGQNKRKRRKSRKYKSLKYLEESLNDYLSTKNKRYIKNIEDNGDLNFLKSLLPDLSKLNTARRHQFKISVLNNLNQLVSEQMSANDAEYVEHTQTGLVTPSTSKLYHNLQ